MSTAGPAGLSPFKFVVMVQMTKKKKENKEVEEEEKSVQGAALHITNRFR